jgi:hypothetical protein
MSARAIALLLALLLFASVAYAEPPPIKDGAVTLPWTEFKALLDKLQATPGPDDPEPPIGFALGRGTLTATLAGGVFDLTATYPLTVFKKGWVVCNLVDASSPLADVQLDGRPAPVANENGDVALVLKGPAQHTLTLRFRAPAAVRPGPGSLSLSLPPGAGQVLTIRPEKTYGGLTVDGATMSESGGVITAILTSSDLNLSYTVALEQQEQAQEKLPPKVLVETSTLVSIDEGFIRAVAQVNFEVRHAPVTAFTLQVPEGFEVADCTGASLVGWKFEETTRLLTATVGFEVKGDYQLTVVLERSTKNESFAFVLPAMPAQNVERERGFYAVQTTGGVEVTVADGIEGLQTVDAKELPGDLRGGATNPIVLSFKYLRHPFAAELRVVRHKTQAVLGAAIDTANYVVQLTDDGDSVTRAVYAVRNNRKQFLELLLPGGEKTALWSTFVADKPVRPSQTKDGKILLPLEKSGYSGSDLDSFTVEVIYFTNLGGALHAAGGLNVDLPEVDLPISQSALTVFAPERFTYRRIGGSMREGFRPRQLDFFSPADGEQMDFEIAEEVLDGLGSLGGRKRAKMPATRQSKAEKEFQTRIRAVQETQDQSGALPARFAVPEKGSALRFAELITIGEGSNVRLIYGARWLPSLAGYLSLALGMLLVWFARRLFGRGRRGVAWLAAGVVAIVVFTALGISVGWALGGAILGGLGLFAQWAGPEIVRQSRKGGPNRGS